MTPRLVIIFDMDGCLADFIEGFTSLANRIYSNVPITLTVEQPYWDGFPNMTEQQISHIWSIVNKSDCFWSDLYPLVDASVIARINRLHDYADVYFVTHRHTPGALYQTKFWLATHGFMHPNVVVTGKKGEVAKSIDADYLIDDKAGNVIYSYYHCKPKLRAYVLDRQYNRFDEKVIGSGTRRVTEISQYLDDIEKHLKGQGATL